MFTTNQLVTWIENLLEMVHEAYEPKDYDRGYFEEIKKRLARLDKFDAPPDDFNVPF